jgi:hypothetical protein
VATGTAPVELASARPVALAAAAPPLVREVVAKAAGGGDLGDDRPRGTSTTTAAPRSIPGDVATDPRGARIDRLAVGVAIRGVPSFGVARRTVVVPLAVVVRTGGRLRQAREPLRLSRRAALRVNLPDDFWTQVVAATGMHPVVRLDTRNSGTAARDSLPAIVVDAARGIVEAEVEGF